MITKIPPDEWVVTEADIDLIEEMLRQAEPDIERYYKGRRRPRPIAVGKSRHVPLEGLGAAALALTVAAVLAKLVTLVETFESTRTRRRRKTHLCVSTCLSIIGSAKLDAGGGFHLNRAISTTDTARRKRKKFNSRK